MIPTTGLKGIYNRINVFSHMQKEDVVDVTMFANEISITDSISSIRVMMTSRTKSLMMTGRDISPNQFKDILSNSQKISEKEYDKNKYQSEFNIITNKIGEGYRKTGNTVMLLARAECYINTGYDLFMYEYIQMLQNNNTTIDNL